MEQHVFSFTYENDSLPNQKSVMHLRTVVQAGSNFHDVNFVGPWSTSGWHGQWNFSVASKTMDIGFNYKGSDDKEHGLLLFGAADRIMQRWQGLDYRGRRVVMTPVARWGAATNLKGRISMLGGVS